MSLIRHCLHTEINVQPYNELKESIIFNFDSPDKLRGDHNLLAMGNDVYTFKVKERMTFRLVLLSIY